MATADETTLEKDFSLAEQSLDDQERIKFAFCCNLEILSIAGIISTICTNLWRESIFFL